MNALRALVDEAVRLRRTLSRRTGLSETELAALEHLVEAPSTPSELARLLEVSTAASTGIVDRLERRGHIVRRNHPTDRRRLEVHVTTDGRAEMLQHLQPMLEALRRLDRSIDPAHRDAVLDYLTEARQAFETITPRR